VKHANRKNLRLAAIGTLAASLCVSASAVAAGDPARGKDKSVACQACHGPDGNSDNPAFPKIAGQHPDYLVRALEAYADGTRQNAVMQGFAATLSAQDREDLAAWFASQEGLSTLEGQR
jgi:cytochrome c553